MPAKKPAIDRARYESFGGILSCVNPPFLAWVDRDMMRSLGYSGSPLWNEGSGDIGPLSAPTEAHVSVTNRCVRSCEGCYVDSKKRTGSELSLDAWKMNFRLLRDMGVFHVALGGGEAFLRDDFDEIVSYCKEIGLVPNLTTSGQEIGRREIAICKMMGQVNISMDGIEERYPINGRQGSFEKADASIKALKKAGITVGINCVVSQKNYPFLEEVIRYAAQRALNEVEFLKYKPSGRGKAAYAEFALSQKSIRNLYPTLIALSKKYRIEVKIDCSFIPALVFHKPPRDTLEKLAVTGCDGGNLLMSVRSNGYFAGCSFVTNSEPVAELAKRWQTSKHLNSFRDLIKKAKQPCKSCDYLSICRCGCRAVSLFLKNDFFAPDPECPFVVDFKSRSKRPDHP